MKYAPARLWTRLTGALKAKSRPTRSPDDLPEVGPNGLLAEPAEHPDDADAELVADKQPGPLARWAKRDQTLTQLQEGYQRVTVLIEEMQKHMALQGERSERISASLEQVARSLSDIPTVSRQQAQTLEAIAAQLEVTNKRAEQLGQVAAELPKVARTQTETLAGISRQLEMAGEQSVVASQTMDKLGAAIFGLGQADNAQAEALQKMNAKTAEQNELLAGLIAKQSKRFVMLFVVTVVLAVAAAAAAIISSIIRGG